jgi:hypothetical protein
LKLMTRIPCSRSSIGVLSIMRDRCAEVTPARAAC